LSGITYNGVADREIILDTTNSNFVWSNRPTGTPITTLRLYFTAGTNGLVSASTYSIYDTGFATATNDPNSKITIGYNNYNKGASQNTISSENCSIKFNLIKGKPSVPGVGQITNNFGTTTDRLYTSTVNYTAPT
jgi:hypothetical protein